MNWKNKYMRINGFLVLQRMLVSCGTYIREQSVNWFVANSLSALSIIHSKVNFHWDRSLQREKVAPWEAETSR